ncbi:NAD(P)/FAD-dependent oxidoreductase [Pseudopontixanthobacter vadosimaris]|uniref:NAD(P)/FAD-dependent oxidoreductase n=1 Tax=Pseudopontixanthobacter vadosimaris TaxID=2726450 RepID=UPI001F10E2F4|nr:FAD-dependent monooxygenase [Pseudopontixanthobacter vadosimaris]
MKGPVIVGAGPAGCAAAIVLARENVQPLLIDRDAEAGDPLCGGFHSWRTIRTLEGLGIDIAALQAAPVRRVVLFARDERAELTLPSPAFGLSRHRLDSALRRRAEESGVRIAIDTIRSVEPGAALGRNRRYEADGLFLATGKHDVRGETRPRVAADPALGLRLRVPADAFLRQLIGEGIELHLFDGGYAGIVLQDGGFANICLALKKSLFEQANKDPLELLAMLSGRHPRFAERLRDGWREQRIDSIGAVPYGWIAGDTEDGLYRLGDQAAVIPSLAGEGISIALASGTMAARHWLANGPAGSRGYQAAFAARARRPVGFARAARALAEHPSRAIAGIRAGRAFPPAFRLLMHLTRID